MTGHPFRLVNPPPGQAEVIEAAIAAIDYPWHRLAAAVEADRDKAVVVEWDDTGGQVSGLFYGSTLRIVLGTRPYHLDDGAKFVFAHEVGHLVDAATLTGDARAALTALFHRGPHVAIGHFNHDHPDAGHVSEKWVDNGNHYPSRLNEAFADQFVAAFAPSLWAGRGVRFVHWTDDHAEVRRIVLAASQPAQAEAAAPRLPEEPSVTIPPHGHPKLMTRIRNMARTIRRLRRRIRRLEHNR